MKKALIILWLLIPGMQLRAQTGFNARSMGMAGAYQGMATGAEVSCWNPANLAFPDRPVFSMDFLNAGFSLGNNSLNLHLYNEYFSEDYFDTYGSWDEAAKSQIIGQIPFDGLEIHQRAQLTSLALSYQNLALAFNTFGCADIQLPREAFEVLLQGLGTDPVAMTNVGGEAVVGTEIALSGGKRMYPGWDWAQFISLGATFKYLLGHAYAKVEEAEGTLLSNTDSIDVNGSYRLLLAAPFQGQGGAGYGLGLDLGAALQISKKLALGLSAHNIFGSISFKGFEEYQGSFSFSQPGLDIDEFDNFADYLDSVTVSADTSFSSSDVISYALPRSLLFSANYRVSQRLTVEADYLQGLNRTAGGSTLPRLALGAQWRLLRFLPTRCGVALGGIQGTTLAFGFGLDLVNYQLDFAFAGQRGLFNSTKGFDVAVSQRIIFGP